MPRYKHTQPGYVTAGALAAGAVGAYVTNRDAPGWLRGLVTGSLALGSVLFSSLTVIVDANTLRFYFGPGVWERRIPLDTIREVTIVRNSPLYGWGIRYTPHGWLYNVAGLDAVEVRTETETFRLGTDEPDRLRRALTDAA